MRELLANVRLPTRLLLVSVLSLSGCAGFGSPPRGVAQGAAMQHLTAFRGDGRRHATGLGPVVQTALGGQVFGWDMNENGDDGVLSESVQSRSGFTSAIETFDQTTGQITKIVAKQNSKLGNEQLIVAGVLANDVGLIDDERDINYVRHDVFHVMAPVSAGKFTGRWTPPHDRNFLIESVADQQSDPVVAILLSSEKLLVSDVAKNTFKPVLGFPPYQTFYGPQLVAQDVTTNRAVVPAQLLNGSQNVPDFVVFNLANGKVTTLPDTESEFGAFEGIAIDSTTGTMCTTTSANYSVEFYNFKTKQGAAEALPGAGGELQTGAAIAADPVNHLFLVTQPISSSSPSGGSTIYVYAEDGTLEETINGFSFSNFSSAVFERVEVNGNNRTGYVNGPGANELQEFSY